MVKNKVLARAVLFLTAVILASCKVQITAPEGGDVVSASGAYNCASGNSCTVEVNDVHFSEDFIADPWQGWVFMGWKMGSRHLCRNQLHRCHLSTMGFETHDILMTILESDETFYLEPEFIEGTPIDEALAAIEDEALLSCLTSAINKNGKLRYAEELEQLACFFHPYNYYPLPKSIKGIEAFKGLKSLSLQYFYAEVSFSLKPLASLTKLQSLTMTGLASSSQIVTDVSPLAELTRLERLELSGNGITDIGPLAGLNRLHFLDLTGNNFSDISPLAGLTQLERLELGGNGITDISPLAGLTQLETLVLSFNNINDIGPLAELVQLNSLYIGTNQISDLSPLAELVQLETLSIHHNNVNIPSRISDISPLAGLTKLKSMDLRHNQISDIGPLAGMTQLDSLYLSYNQISDIGPLAELTQLPFLDITNNEISDISPLAEFKHLSSMNLQRNKISDISPLAGLTQLETLDLSFNNISDIGPLAGLTQLQTLNLNRNEIIDISPLAGLTKLGWLRLAQNKIDDFSFGSFEFTNVYSLNLARNQISTAIESLDSMVSLSQVKLSFNPISCGEVERLLNRNTYRVTYRDPLDNCL